MLRNVSNIISRLFFARVCKHMFLEHAPAAILCSQFQPSLSRESSGRERRRVVKILPKKSYFVTVYVPADSLVRPNALLRRLRSCAICVRHATNTAVRRDVRNYL